MKSQKSQTIIIKPGLVAQALNLIMWVGKGQGSGLEFQASHGFAASLSLNHIGQETKLNLGSLFPPLDFRFLPTLESLTRGRGPNPVLQLRESYSQGNVLTTHYEPIETATSCAP